MVPKCSQVFHTLRLAEGQDVTAISLNEDNTNPLVSTADKQFTIYTNPVVSHFAPFITCAHDWRNPFNFLSCDIERLIRMWKAMLECHQSQIMTISSAYQAKNSMPPSESTYFSKQAAMNLQDEVLGENPNLHHCLHTKNMLV
ncbi:hypothetical protein KSP40_PGU013411 [Platanthera guangdongensis]|uniref:DUF632 domain-containing protein n=1 Tax=Platanthera guangdongensis TaxID=2320717 RepID=A0ABR2MD37_9ASPA